MYICIYLCKHIRMNAAVLTSLELGLQAFVGFPMWYPELNSGSLKDQYALLILNYFCIQFFFQCLL